MTPGLIGLMALVTLIWGANWPIMKITVAEVPPFTFRVICALGGGTGLMVIAWLSGQKLGVPRAAWRYVTLSALFNQTLWNLLTPFGVSLMASGRASILAFTMPVWASLFAIPILGEKLSGKRALGVALGVAGMAILIGGDAAAMGAAPLGALFMIGAAMSWGLGTVLNRRGRPEGVGTVVLAAWQNYLGGIPIVVLAAIYDPWPPNLDLSFGAMFGVAYNALICFIFCVWAWFKVSVSAPTAVAGVSTQMIPVVGVTSAAIILGEPIGLQELAALVVVLAALTAVLWPERTPARAAS
ncbi:MAG: DMT family transporter [Alphaproteobacteria bacterium]|nr:DMT family transporter [Alphaproteobacteria bacterium]